MTIITFICLVLCLNPVFSRNMCFKLKAPKLIVEYSQPSTLQNTTNWDNFGKVNKFIDIYNKISVCIAVIRVHFSWDCLTVNFIMVQKAADSGHTPVSVYQHTPSCVIGISHMANTSLLNISLCHSISIVSSLTDAI